MMAPVGFEPTCFSAIDFESIEYSSSSMEPYLLKISLTVLLGILSFFDISDTEISFSFSKIIDFLSSNVLIHTLY